MDINSAVTPSTSSFTPPTYGKIVQSGPLWSGGAWVVSESDESFNFYFLSGMVTDHNEDGSCSLCLGALANLTMNKKSTFVVKSHKDLETVHYCSKA